jgi:hypothetical protein
MPIQPLSTGFHGRVGTITPNSKFIANPRIDHRRFRNSLPVSTVSPEPTPYLNVIIALSMGRSFQY